VRFPIISCKIKQLVLWSKCCFFYDMLRKKIMLNIFKVNSSCASLIFLNVHLNKLYKNSLCLICSKGLPPSLHRCICALCNIKILNFLKILWEIEHLLHFPYYFQKPSNIFLFKVILLQKCFIFL